MKLCAVILLGLLTLVGSRAAPIPKTAESDPEIRPGPGVTGIKKLSDYLPSLANTPGDTFVYFLEGKEPGGTVFVAGGTHANEIAGVIAATVLIEHARVQKGRLLVIGHANNSAATYPDPTRKVPAILHDQDSRRREAFPVPRPARLSPSIREQ